MNPTNLIIEDFDFYRYPITRVYILGDKTVIQIEEANYPESRDQLYDKVEDLEEQNSSLEEKIKDLEGENEDLKKDKDKLDEQLNESFDLLESVFGFTRDFHETMQKNLCALKVFLNNKARSDAEWEDLEEELRGLQVDNRALASTIDEKDKTISDLTEQLLAAQEN